jgi:hypothetical protein
MYRIETAPFGFRITIGDRVSLEEATEQLIESRTLLRVCTKPFGVLVDIRTLQPLADDVQAVIDETQRLYRRSGLERSAVVLASAIMTIQFMRIAKDTGVYAHERYVDASKSPRWEQLALDWIVRGIDPDLASRRPPR